MFYVIPQSLLRKRLTLTDTLVYFVIDSFDRDDGCDLQNEQLCQVLDKSRATINNSIQRLKSTRLIEDNGMSNEYRRINIRKKIKDSAYDKIKLQAFKEIANKINYSLPVETIHEPVKYEFVEFWNGLTNTRKHKPGTKLYVRIRTNILQLRRGTLYKNKFSSEWLKKRKIKTNMLEKKYSKDEIHLGLKRLNMMCTAGYWPEDKKWIKKMDLANLIYNPRMMNSWFITVMISTPELLNTTHIKTLCPEAFNHALEYLSDCRRRDKPMLRSGINTIIKFYRKLPEAMHDYGTFADFCFDEGEFFKEYIKYLKGQDWIKNKGVSLLSVKSKLFRRFLDDQWPAQNNCMNRNLSKYL